MKKLILVMGAASSGTRMMESIVKAVGYTGSPEVHAFNWLELPSDKVVWRRSFPHGGLGNRYWPGIIGMADKGKREGYRVYGIYIHRSPLVTALSQVRAGHNFDYFSAMEDVRRAESIIPNRFSEANIKWSSVLYETFVSMPRDTMQQISLDLGLREFAVDCPIQIKDGNEKYRNDVLAFDIEQLTL